MKSLLSFVHAPETTGVPPCNPHRDLMEMPSGEIRHYGFCLAAGGRGGAKNSSSSSAAQGRGIPVNVVARSRDRGMSWSEEILSGPCVGAMARSPWSGTYLTLLRVPDSIFREEAAFLDEESAYSALRLCPETGVWLFRSQSDPDEGVFDRKKISSLPLHIQRQPLALKFRRRWVLPFETWHSDGFLHPGILFSDDDGEHWEQRLLPYPPMHEVVWPHRGCRWRQPGCEPVVAELPSGRLQMLLRTSTDRHYQCFSDDGGESWTPPEPSIFYSVATMPNLVTLRDGRLLAVWNNSTPLPEFDHSLQTELGPDERNGRWEDVFTNRDVLHAAVSEDSGKSWIGFRELFLNECRNDGDFRCSGGSFASLDKSVHQNQLLELGDNKILVAFGQHALCRKFLVFDLSYLYEESRSEDFSSGAGAWSLQLYLKSLSGGFRGGGGHCAFNRRQGAALIPHPDGLPKEVLQIARHPDPRLLSEKEGAVWNFPAGRSGKLNLRLRLQPGSAGIRFCLTDRWFNPSDPVVQYFSPFAFELDSAGRINGDSSFRLRPGEWTDLTLLWNLDPVPLAEIFPSGTSSCVPVRSRICRPPEGDPVTSVEKAGISYIHFQSMAETADPSGVLLERIEKLPWPSPDSADEAAEGENKM